jgi:hypothetical protein
MDKQSEACSLRQYARHCGCAPSYICKLVARGVLVRNPDGTLDQRRCDALRALNTNMVRGELRKIRRGADLTGVTRRKCLGCGDSYLWGPDSPDPEHFCTLECCEAVARGETTKEIRRRIRQESRELDASLDRLSRSGGQPN